jgi:PTS system fructose-specific IIB component
MKMVTNSVAIGPVQAETIHYLHDEVGLEVYAQKVPADRKQNLSDLLLRNGF